MEKSFIVSIPEGYKIDKEKSTFEKIVFKKKFIQTASYTDIAQYLFYNKTTFYIDGAGQIDNFVCSNIQFVFDANNCTSKKQAEKLLAINKLMNVAKYLNGDWEPNWETAELKYTFVVLYNKLRIHDLHSSNFSSVYFKSKELAKKAIEILGEDTIKLALSTDW